MHIGYATRGPRLDGKPGRAGEGGYVEVPDVSAAFHNYGVSWQADQLRLYFDDRESRAYWTASDMHVPMYLLANLAVGRPWLAQVVVRPLAGRPDLVD